MAKSSQRTFVSLALRYGSAILAVIITYLLRVAITAWLGEGLPTYITFYPVVVLVGLLAGLWPGLLATALSAIVVDFTILPPLGFGIERSIDIIGMVIFVGMGVFLNIGMELYRKTRQREAAFEKELAIRENQAWLQLSMEAAKAGTWVWDIQSNENIWSDELWTIYGLKKNSCHSCYENWLQTVHPDDREQAENTISQAVKSGTELNAEWRVNLQNDQKRWLMSRGRPILDDKKRIVRYIGIVIDITERKKAEEHIQNLNRAHKAISESSQLSAKATDEAVFLNAICQIIVKNCGYSMVWIGYAQDNENKTVIPIASAGFEKGYLDTLNITWADSDRGRGPTGTAIRTGTVQKCADMLNDPNFAPWRAEALKRGYASSISLPLNVANKTIGAIAIYATQPDAFHRDEANLLMELTDHVAFGITSIRTRLAQKQAEEALRESEQQVRHKLQSVLSPEGDLGVLELADLIDPSAIRSLMKNFYAVTGIPMAILDIHGRILVGVGWQNICTQFHRIHPESARNCLESDTQLTANMIQGQHRLYKCKNNLWDMATPIIINDQHIGNIFIGQFFFDDESVDREYFRNQAKRFGFDERVYLEALDRVPRLSRTVVDQAMAFFIKLADTLSQLGYSNAKLARSLEEQKRIEIEIQNIAKFPSQNPHPVLRLSCSGTILYCNESGKILLNQWATRAGEQLPSEWCDKISAALKSGRNLNEELLCDKQLFSLTLVPILGENYVNIYGRDITQQRKAQLALRRSHDKLREKVHLRTAELAQTVDILQQEVKQRMLAEQQLQDRSRILEAFFSHTVTPLVILDRNFNFIRVNAAYAKACARDISEFAGHNHFEFYPYADNQRIFDGVVRNKNIYHAIAKPFSFPDHPEWGVSYWNWTLVPILDNRGEVELLVFSLEDVTEQKKAELELLASQEKLKTMATALELAEERERRKIARDLHDSIGQILSFSTRELQSMQKTAPKDIAKALEEISNQLTAAISQARTLSFDLSPTILYDLGLSAAIEELAEKYAKAENIIFSFDDDGKIIDLPDPIKVFLYRAVRELLINTVKHAQADVVRVSLTEINQEIRITVEDNGQGFIQNKISGRSHGFGLFSIQERLNHLGGRLVIETNPGQGTKIILFAPLNLEQLESKGIWL